MHIHVHVHCNIIVSVQSSHVQAKWVKFNGMHLKRAVVVVLSLSTEFAEIFVLPSQGALLGVKVYEVTVILGMSSAQT